MSTSQIRTQILVLVVTLAPASLSLGSIQGTYLGNFLVGNDGGAAYSYIHESTTAKKMGDAGYYQQAGGNVVFAVDARRTIEVTFNDNGGNGLNDGDTIDLSFEVDLLQFDGSRNSSNSLLDVVGTLTVAGTLAVGGTSSSTFTNGISNITAADTLPAHSGLSYTINVDSSFSIHGTDYFAGDSFNGDAFFQSGDLAGPFNGVSYENGKLSFAVWGDSRNKDGTGPYDTNNTGSFTPNGGQSSDSPLGFDLYFEGQIVPEISSFLTWGLLTGIGVVFTRRR